MAKRRELKCEICGAAFVYRGVGQPAKRCLKHRHNRNRDLRVAQEALSGGLPTAPLEAAGVETDGGSKRSLESTARAWRARRLAVGLGLEADPRRAAELVGLEPQSAEELAELVEEAGRYDDLRDRKPQAQAALLQAAARGLVVDCGCFGSEAPSSAGMARAIARDLVMLGAIVALYGRKVAKLPAAASSCETCCEPA